MVAELIIPPKKRFKRFVFGGFTRRTPRTYVSEISVFDAPRIQFLAAIYGYEVHIYGERYARSSNYRRTYFRKRKPDVFGRYRCVYCGKKIYPKDMTVDHIIPVDAARHDPRMRLLLPFGVNDISNLAASCRKCNSKKRASTFIGWRIRAMIGKHTLFWVALRVAEVFAIYAVCRYLYLNRTDLIERIMDLKNLVPFLQNL